MRRAAIVVALLVAAPAHAQVGVAVDLNHEGELLAGRIGITSRDLELRFQDQIDSVYGATHIDGFLRSFADASAFSMRGLGVDYASDPNGLVVGIGASFAIAASQFSAYERPANGMTNNLGLMAGYNLSRLGAPRWTVYGNGYYRSASDDFLRAGITSFGLHAQYRLVHPQPDQGTAKMLRWIGIDVTTGFELTRWTVGVEKSLWTSLRMTGTSGSTMIYMDSTAMFDLAAMAMTMPIDVSTGIRIAMLLSLYVGAGLDITAGTSRINANAGGKLISEGGRNIGMATITGRGNGDATPLAPRILAGAQLDLWKIKVYAQINGSDAPAASVGFGVRGVL